MWLLGRSLPLCRGIKGVTQTMFLHSQMPEKDIAIVFPHLGDVFKCIWLICVIDQNS